MKHVLIVGSSHVAALKLAWGGLKTDFGDRLEVDFFVAALPFFDRVGFRDPLYGDVSPGALTADEVAMLTRVNGRTTVDLESYDAILLAGMFWPGHYAIVRFLKFFAVDGLYDAAKPQRLTRTAFAEFYGAALADRPSSAFWSGLRHPKVTLLFCPMPVAILRRLKPEHLLYKGIWADDDIDTDKMPPLLAYQKTLNERHYAARGIDVMHQPPPTLTADCLTKDEYCRDPVDLAGTPDYKLDAYHMNGRYGALCLKDWFKRVLA